MTNFLEEIERSVKNKKNKDNNTNENHVNIMAKLYTMIKVGWLILQHVNTWCMF